MFRVFTSWLRLLPRSKKITFVYCLFSIVELSTFIFQPLSFARIATLVSEQNIRIAFLWATINFGFQLLAPIITELKHDLLVDIKNKIKIGLVPNLNKRSISKCEPYLNNISEFVFSFNNSIMSILKMVSLVLFALYYNSFLSIIIAISIIISYLLSFFLQNKLNKTTKSLEDKRSILHNHNTLINCLWAIFVFLINLYIINLIRNLSVTLSAFLLLSTFISNYITKYELSANFLIKIKELENSLIELKKFDKKTNLANKIDIYPHTKKNK